MVEATAKGESRRAPGSIGKPANAGNEPIALASDPLAADGSTGRLETTQTSASRGFADWLASNSLSLALTSYQTGQLILLGVLPDGRLSVHQRNFVRAMGLCASQQRLYVAGIGQIWRLENVLRPGQFANTYFDRLYMPRNAQTTGDLDVHEIAVDREGRVVFVNTKYSCISTFSLTDSFKPIWKPAFVSRLAPEDRCHLNGLALQDGRPRYVTAVSQSDIVDGWRERRGQGGVLIDVDNGRVVTDELSMPHSPRVTEGALWVLDSGRGYLCRVDPKSGARENVGFCPGFMRGLSFWRNYAAVATSLPRDGAFTGLELEANLRARDGEARCGVFIMDVRNGDILHWLRFEGGIRELFDIVFIPGVRAPMCVGLENVEMRSLITYEEDPGNHPI